MIQSYLIFDKPTMSIQSELPQNEKLKEKFQKLINSYQTLKNEKDQLIKDNDTLQTLLEESNQKNSLLKQKLVSLIKSKKN